MKIYYCKLIVFIIFWSTSLQGQTIPFTSKYYSFRDGLPDRTVYDIYQDSRGLIWASTASGLSMFDGYRIRNFSNSPVTNFARKIDIEAAGEIVEDDHHNLIIQLENLPDSLEVLNLNTFESYGISLQHNSNLEGKVMDVFSVQLGKTYVLTRSSSNLIIYKWLGQQNFQVVKKIETLPTETTCYDQLVANASGDFWVFDFFQQHIIYSNPAGQQQSYSLHQIASTKKFHPEKPKETLDIFHLSKADELWWSSTLDNALYYIPKQSSNFFKLENNSTAHSYDKVWEDGPGNLLFGDFNLNYCEKLILVNAQKQIFDFGKVRQKEAKITSLHSSDFSKYFYLGSHNGFYHFIFSNEKKNVHHFLNEDLEDGHFGNVMRGFVGDGKNMVYTVEEGSHWFALNTDNFQLEKIEIKDSDGNFFKKISCGGNLILDGDFLWGVSCDEVGSGRIHRYNLVNQTWKTFYIPQEKVFGRMLLPKSENEFWVFTLHRIERSGDIFIFNKSTGEFLPIQDAENHPPPLEKKVINHVIQDKNKNIWIATSMGLVHWNIITNKFQTHYLNPSNKTRNHFSTIYEHENDQLLLGTMEQGLFYFDIKSKEFFPFSFSQNNNSKIIDPASILPNNNIASILKVGENQILVGTFLGLAYLNLAEKTAIHYFLEDGLSNNEYNRLSFYQDKKDHIYMGGINGFDVFKLEEFKSPKSLPAPRLTRFFFYDNQKEGIQSQYHSLQFSRPIEIQPYDLLFGFDFMIPNHLNFANHSFQIWLKGWENGYNPPSETSTVRYYRLPAGSYELYIKAKDSQGNISEPLIIPIVVHQVFYKSWWFLSLIFLGLAGLIYYFSKMRINFLRKKEIEEQERNETRRKFLELELKTLRMQLNPHFMFNALGAIQFFLQKNDARLAINYLGDFARLMRLFLESSKRRYVMLEEEIELIKLYVSLEQMRYDKRFEVTYDIDPSLDVGMVEIPALLLQPFIENAINHGLRHKKERGHLLIKVTNDEKNKIIECIIEDDGIGRKKAAEIKKKSLKKHKSRGTQIVQERLNAFKTSGEITIELKTEDAYPSLENCGTLVTIRIQNLD